MNIKDDTLDALVIEPILKPKTSVIWLHGLGADCHDFIDVLAQIRLPDEIGTRFIFPNAPKRKITMANNDVMRAWFDVEALGSKDSMPSNVDGILESQALIEKIIEREKKEYDISSDKIVLCGFSQGGAMSLQCGLRHKKPLAGILVFSGWLPSMDGLGKGENPANQKTPIVIFHGRSDDVVPMSWAKESCDYLSSLKYDVILNDYDMAHSMCAYEIHDISKHLRQILTSIDLYA